MTKREASRIAMREMGYTEKQITDMQKSADERFVRAFGPAMLQQEIESQLELLPGQTERDFIEYLKAIGTMAKASNPKIVQRELDKLKKSMEKDMEQN